MKTVVYESDVLNDFSVREGALFVYGNKPKTTLPYGAEAVLPNIFKIHAKANKEDWIIIGAADKHFYEDAELTRNEGGVFDDHAMNGTWGQLRLKELEPQKDIYIRAKDGPGLGMKIYTEQELEKYIQTAKDMKMHLIFEKQSYDVGTNPNFEPAFKMLLDQGLEKVIVDGFATDYCDKAAVLKMADLRDKYKKNLQIYVVTDAIEAVNIDFQGNIEPEFGNKALKEMQKKGAKLVTTKDVLEGRV